MTVLTASNKPRTRLNAVFTDFPTDDDNLKKTCYLIEDDFL